MKTAVRVLLLLSAIGLSACMQTRARPACSKGGPIATICGLRNPEDLELIAGRDLLLISNMRFDALGKAGGFVAALALPNGQLRRLWPGEHGAETAAEPALGDPSCSKPPAAQSFYPHGLTSHISGNRSLVYVAAHAGRLGGREAIEIFELRGRGRATRLLWKACIPTPDAVEINDLAIAADGEIIATNYQPDASLWHTIRAMILGKPTGDLLGWQRERGWRHLAGTEALMANGVAVSADGEMVFYSETLTGKVYRLPRMGGPSVSVEIGGNPDNMTWTSAGTLLVATHTSGPAFFLCALGRAPCKTSWEIYEVNPVTMAFAKVLSHDGQTIGAVATALEVGGQLYLGSVFDDRIGIAQARPSRF